MIKGIDVFLAGWTMTIVCGDFLLASFIPALKTAVVALMTDDLTRLPYLKWLPESRRSRGYP